MVECPSMEVHFVDSHDERKRIREVPIVLEGLRFEVFEFSKIDLTICSPQSHGAHKGYTERIAFFSLWNSVLSVTLWLKFCAANKFEFEVRSWATSAFIANRWVREDFLYWKPRWGHNLELQTSNLELTAFSDFRYLIRNFFSYYLANGQSPVSFLQKPCALATECR